jgi:hypothetical protein
MKVIWRLVAITILLAIHFGLSSLVHNGWPFSILVICIILFVWRNMQDSVVTIMLPTALIIDFISPSRFPVLTIASLGTWFVISLIQNRWLTNHSIASLIGMAVVGIILYKTLFAFLIILGNLLNLSPDSISLVWKTRSILIIGLIEYVVLILLGLLLNAWKRIFGFRFLYGSR